MKTKLLKKIRKRYSIIKINSVDRSENEYWKDICRGYNLPFYWLNDNDNSYSSMGFKSFPAAYNNLLEKINTNYSQYSTHTTNDDQKVWWTNNK